MGRLTATLLLSIFAISVEVLFAANHVKNPMVAFLCNKPARYLKEDVWQTDTKTDCLHDPVDILNYCRKVYPHMDVTNIMESASEVVIENWCNFHGKCHQKHHSHTVRPYRCLVGPFQSEALLVPEHCIFDHIEGDNDCKSYDQWNETSAKSCAGRGKVQQSFAPLRPCKVGRFDGVEFVCCPGKSGDALDYFKKKHVTHDNRPDEKLHIVSGILSKHAIDDIGEVDTDVNTTPAKPVEKKEVYVDYIHNPEDKASGVSEHEYFQNAKKTLVKHHHEKVTKMMKEWAAARQHVHDMKLTDPKGSDKLNKEITSRFQKTYEALEEEGDAEKKQLVSIHQQRVQAKLNIKKRHSMEHYMAVLTEAKPDAARILKALKHYLRVEEKDRVHSINHYKHVRDTENSDAAELLRERTATHLQILTERIQQAIDMLSRVPDYEKKIRTQIDSFLQTFHNVDVLVTDLIEKHEKKHNDKILRKYKDELKETMQSHDTVESHDADVKPAKPDLPLAPPKPSVLHHVSLKKSPPVLSANKFDDETMEDEHNLPAVDVKKSSHVAHMSVNKLHIQEQGYVKKEAMNAAVQTTSTVGIVIGSITVFIVIIAGVAILRHRSMTPTGQGFVEVAQNASTEDRQISKMQMNGYENPTYKYFEAQPGAPVANA